MKFDVVAQQCATTSALSFVVLSKSWCVVELSQNRVWEGAMTFVFLASPRCLSTVESLQVCVNKSQCTISVSIVLGESRTLQTQNKQTYRLMVRRGMESSEVTTFGSRSASLDDGGMFR